MDPRADPRANPGALALWRAAWTESGLLLQHGAFAYVAGLPSQRRCVSHAGSTAIFNFRVRRGGFEGEIVGLSDSGQRGGSVRFQVGDGSVNAAVDEIIRTLPPGVQRRAIVPATFDLDRGTRPEYPRPAPAGTKL